MKLVELIQVRSFSENDRQHAIDMFNTLSLKGLNLPSQIKLFKSQTLAGDLNICLCWDSVENHAFKTAFGEKLVSAFKHFGWISHSVWEPLKEII